MVRKVICHEEGSLDFDYLLVSPTLVGASPPVSTTNWETTAQRFAKTRKIIGLKTQEGCYDVALT
jgi:hypothetical protein